MVLGSAPDAFDGVHMKSEYLADGCGGWRKPFLRCYVGGGTGVYAVAQAWFQVASGMLDTALVLCEEKMSTCPPHPQATFLTIFDPITEQPLKPNLLWIFALEQNRYMETYGITVEEIARVSVKNKRNALNHPAAQLGANLTVKDVLASEIMAWPVHRLMVSPQRRRRSHRIAAEEVARRLTDQPIWIQGVGWCLDSAYWTNRDLAYPEYVEKAAWMAYRMAGVKSRARKSISPSPTIPLLTKSSITSKACSSRPRAKRRTARRRRV